MLSILLFHIHRSSYILNYRRTILLYHARWRYVCAIVCTRTYVIYYVFFYPTRDNVITHNDIRQNSLVALIAQRVPSVSFWTNVTT